MKHVAEISAQGLNGKLCRNEPMSRHTSWRTGGAAAWFYTPAGLDDLSEFIKRIPCDMPIVWCGLGSNMLVRDGGFDGVVISTLKGLDRISKCGDNSVYAEAGVPCAKAARYSVKNALSGSEFFIGIPGTVGGALAMNAGCFGHETWEIVQRADTIDRSSVRHRRSISEVEYGYRYSKLPENEWFTGAEFNLVPNSAEAGKQEIKKLLKIRMETQPVQTANAGSVFKNPPGKYAAELIESVGLKNHAIGQARISPKHANFIENRGKAKAVEIEGLIELAREKVEAIHGVSLQPEVKIIGTV